VIDAKLKGLRWLRLALFLPVVTPTIVAALAFRLLYNEDTGLLNALLHQFGFGGIRWLSERPWTLVSAAIVTLWKGVGFYMMIFLAGLMGVPRELKEAAALDGADRWQVFRTVTFPALLPSISLVFVVSSISALKVFDELYVTIQGAPIGHKTVVPLIYSIAFEEGDFGMACAVGMTLFAIILMFSVVNLRMSRGRASA
jgi:putative chitobiose transport system permease protein